jgi:hypothetical protein
MNADHEKKGISRAKFLKNSSVMLGGFAMFPSFATLSDLTSFRKLTINGLSGFQIVTVSNADPITQEAAKQLQQYLSKISGTTLSIVGEGAYKNEKAIYVGRTNYAKKQNIDFNQLKEDGYIFRRFNNNFIIAGGSEKGALYGVYSLLESLGVKRYTPSYTYIPQKNEISLPKNDVEIVPFINYRTTSYYRSGDDFADWHRLSSRDAWGLFVHTFQVLVPPQKYGKTHPEYFSLIDGKRNPVTQLCLSNEEVFNTVVAELRKRIDKNPKAKYWSVSQNDNDKYCQCDRCTKLNEQYGGVPSGSIIWFVNKVAKEFPDKTISTLAYWYTRTAPKNIKIEPNVNIMLCNIESTREKPVFDTDPAFTHDLQDWAKLTNDILIWDYNVQFASPLSPFPNLHTIGPNIKFYTDNSVRALFMQANSPQDEFGYLRAYLICKLMWNPDADPDSVMNDFLDGYYGQAAPYIKQYIDAMRQSLLNSGFKLNIFGYARDAKKSYLSSDMMKQYTQLFERAEEAVKDNTQLLKRVGEAKLPLMFAEIEIGQSEIDTPRSFYEHTSSGKVIVKPEMRKLVDQFVQGAKQAGVVRVRERAITVDDYMDNFQRIYTKMDEMNSAISFGKKITSTTSPKKGMAEVKRLTDGVFGSYETWRSPGDNWVEYEGVHMDFVLDLGEVMPVNSIEMDFLNSQAQADWNLLILPRYVTYAISENSKRYSKAIKIDNPHNPNPAENPDITKIPFQSFAAKLNNKKARYIKVHAESLLKTPSWHIRAGQPASIYADEIVVR